MDDIEQLLDRIEVGKRRIAEKAVEVRARFEAVEQRLVENSVWVRAHVVDEDMGLGLSWERYGKRFVVLVNGGEPTPLENAGLEKVSQVVELLGPLLSEIAKKVEGVCDAVE